MKFLKVLLYIIITLVVIVGILSIIAPTKVAISRTTAINASPNVVFKNISTFENLHKWSPWDKKDPNMKHELEGTDGTIGAKWKWEGNDSVGKGEQTLTKIDPDKEVDMHLHIIKPFNSHNEVSLLLTDTSNATRVTWTFKTNMSRPMNVMTLFMDMDKALGKDFEAGLQNLKELSEQEAATSAPTSNYQISERDMPAMIYVGKRETVTFDNIGNFFAINLPKIGEDVGKAKLEMAGPPSGIFYTYDTAAMKTDMAAVFPVKEIKSPLKGWETFEIPAGKALMVDYFGDYSKTAPVYNQLGTYAQQRGLKNKLVIEEYTTDPMVVKDTAKWETKIYYYVE